MQTPPQNGVSSFQQKQHALPVTRNINSDIVGDELKARRFQMLEDIARELAGEVVFPTYFDALLRLKEAMQNPNHSLSSIASTLSIEPKKLSCS